MSVPVLQEDTKRYQNAGFDGFIDKPYKKEEFIKIIMKNLSSSL